MSDKTSKYIKKLSEQDYEKVDMVIANIRNKDFTALDYKKLKGETNMYRVRVGRHRIIFKDENGIIRIISVGKRDENTY